jgi:hypothetical protein
MPSAQTTVDASRLMMGPLVIYPASLAIDTLTHETTCRVHELLERRASGEVAHEG